MSDHKNLASALVASLADLTVVDKGRTANVGSYKYDYAALEDVVKATRPVLASHGLTALTPLGTNNDDITVTVVLVHASGEQMELGQLTFPHGKDAQATGSSITYHRRYALLAALGMAAGDDDDDGASAAPREFKSQDRNLNSAPANSSSTKLNDEQIGRVQAWLEGGPARKAELKAKFGTMQPARIDVARWPELEQFIAAGEGVSGGTPASPLSAPAASYSEEPF